MEIPIAICERYHFKLYLPFPIQSKRFLLTLSTGIEEFSRILPCLPVL
ncbi:hypothetical protein DESC_880133 [Desulfosarcina cetonica]|nr:hypothetical protein DESC_880133 [Desulfosarcina cetonica]